MYDDIDFNRLFDNQSELGRSRNLGTFYESRIEEAEAFLGFQLPPSLIAFLKIQNGGLLSDTYTECWLTAIYGIGENKDTPGSIQSVFDEWKNELQCPVIGVPFGETQSAGHDMYYLDYSAVDESGEPRIVLVDNECGNTVRLVANNFREFIGKVYRKENLEGTPAVPDEATAEKEKIAKQLDDINGNVSLCRGGIFLAVVGLLLCLLFKKYILVAVCAVIAVLLFVPERRFSREYDRIKGLRERSDGCI
ncbi:MAG: SMI1/KNR4 family protein [Lachnospiraceae bacterium]|nr:SMI1/KNR4 family protein [Lachnospiraceae bacterium]